jgi:hypothetical protein
MFGKLIYLNYYALNFYGAVLHLDTKYHKLFFQTSLPLIYKIWIDASYLP